MVKEVGYIINESFIPGFTDSNIISEDKEGRVIGEGVLQVAEEVNRNRRIYPASELFPQLKAPRTLELLEAGYLRAELGHPLSKELVRQQMIDDSRTCAQFLKIWTEGNKVMGRFRGTNNAFGEAFNKDLLDGCKPAWSLRALGTIQSTPRGAEVHNLKIITWDQVIYPSHPSAYTQRIVSESAGIPEEPVKKSRLQKVYEDYLAEDEKNSVVTENGLLIPFSDKDVINYIKSESANLKYVQEQFDFVYDTIDITADGSKAILESEGTRVVVNLEQQIRNEIMNYCSNITTLL